MSTQIPSSTPAKNGRSGSRFFRVIPFVFLALSIDTSVVRGQESKTDQEKAIAALVKRGGHVFQDETQPDRPVISVDLDETEIDDAGLSNLKGLTRLQLLSIDGTRITDIGLANLKGLTSLTDLSLDNTEIGDAGLAQLDGLKNLQKLSLDRTRVSDDGLRHLKGMKRLENLSFAGTAVLTFSYGFLEGLGYPRLSMFSVWPIMAVLWIVGLLLARRRYE